VTVNVSATGTAVVTLTSYEDASTDSGSCYVSFAVSGDTTIAASDTQALVEQGNLQQASATFVVTGLHSGSNTFTAKYRTSTGGNTCHFANRALIVTPY
jgi:hypothetical protein